MLEAECHDPERVKRWVVLVDGGRGLSVTWSQDGATDAAFYQVRFSAAGGGGVQTYRTADQPFVATHAAGRWRVEVQAGVTVDGESGHSAWSEPVGIEFSEPPPFVVSLRAITVLPQSRQGVPPVQRTCRGLGGGILVAAAIAAVHRRSYGGLDRGGRSSGQLGAGPVVALHLPPGRSHPADDLRSTVESRRASADTPDFTRGRRSGTRGCTDIGYETRGPGGRDTGTPYPSLTRLSLDHRAMHHGWG